MRIPVKYLAKSFAIQVDPVNGVDAPTYDNDGYVELVLPTTHLWLIDGMVIGQITILVSDDKKFLNMLSVEDDEFEFDMDDDMDFRRIQVYEKCGLKEKTALLNKFKDQV